jgi:hypothetical protein
VFRSAIMGSLIMARPAPGEQATNASRWLRLPFAVRAFTVGSRIAPSAGRSSKPCLADPLASFTHGAFLKSPFLYQGGMQKFESGTKGHPRVTIGVRRWRARHS